MICAPRRPSRWCRAKGVFRIVERLRADGSVSTPLDKASLVEATRKLKEERVEGIAVCYLHAYRHDRHEKETFDHLRKELPNAYVSLSSEVLPQIKEYERVSTTVVNAYVGPGVRAYFADLERKLTEAGYAGALYIILSHGGVAPIEEASRLAAATVLSGPAGGVAGCRHAALLTGNLNLIPFDMGGTSTDISLIVAGEAALSSNRGLAGQRIALRSLDIISIGAGGGSIARAEGGALDVGPQSAGALPGPVCYGTKGTEPTVTDANVVLGRLDAERPLPGRGPLDRAAAEGALDALAAKLGLTRERTAEGIVEVINVKMADGIRLATVSRGVDPRDYALFSFGGAAGLHACDVARGLDISRIIVPNFASVLSAWGMLSTPLRYEVSRTHIGDTRGLSAKDLRALYDELAKAATRKITGKTPGEIRIQRSAEMRYGEQIYEIDVPLDHLDWEAPNADGSGHRRLPAPARGALHLFAARPGHRARQRTRSGDERHGRAARPSQEHGESFRLGAASAPDPPRKLAGSAGLSDGRPRAGPKDRGSGVDRSRHDDGSLEGRRSRPRQSLGMARHRRPLSLKSV